MTPSSPVQRVLRPPPLLPCDILSDGNCCLGVFCDTDLHSSKSATSSWEDSLPSLYPPPTHRSDTPALHHDFEVGHTHLVSSTLDNPSKHLPAAPHRKSLPSPTSQISPSSFATVPSQSSSYTPLPATLHADIESSSTVKVHSHNAYGHGTYTFPSPCKSSDDSPDPRHTYIASDATFSPPSFTSAHQPSLQHQPFAPSFVQPPVEYWRSPPLGVYGQTLASPIYPRQSPGSSPNALQVQLDEEGDKYDPPSPTSTEATPPPLDSLALPYIHTQTLKRRIVADKEVWTRVKGSRGLTGELWEEESIWSWEDEEQREEAQAQEEEEVGMNHKREIDHSTRDSHLPSLPAPSPTLSVHRFSQLESDVEYEGESELFSEDEYAALLSPGTSIASPDNIPSDVDDEYDGIDHVKREKEDEKYGPAWRPYPEQYMITGRPRRGPNLSHLEKVFHLVHTGRYTSWIDWNVNGDALVVPDEDAFAEHVMPHYFGSNQWDSFKRQLTTYKFSRTMTTRQAGKRTVRSHVITHPALHRDDAEIWKLVERLPEPADTMLRSVGKKSSFKYLGPTHPLRMVSSERALSKRVLEAASPHIIEESGTSSPIDNHLGTRSWKRSRSTLNLRTEIKVSELRGMSQLKKVDRPGQGKSARLRPTTSMLDFKKDS